MVIEQDVKIIVMLTNFIEGEKVKADEYFPSKLGEVFYTEDYLLTNQGLKESNGIIFRYFYIQNLYTTKIKSVYHIHCISWPDFGLPTHETLSELLKIVSDLRQTDTNPVLVHCSAGCGRTGVFSTTDTAFKLRELNYKPTIDLIFDIVSSFRQQRMGIVQTLQQYSFCYSFLSKNLQL